MAANNFFSYGQPAYAAAAYPTAAAAVASPATVAGVQVRCPTFADGFGSSLFDYHLELMLSVIASVARLEAFVEVSD